MKLQAAPPRMARFFESGVWALIFIGSAFIVLLLILMAITVIAIFCSWFLSLLT